MRHATAIYVLVLLVVPAYSYTPETKEIERLEELVEREGDMVYVALYGLPETRAAIMRENSFVENLMGGRWDGIAPGDVVEDLSPSLKRAIMGDAARKLASLPVEEKEQAYVRLQQWLRADRFLNTGLYCGGDSMEDMMGWLYSVPQTRSLFDPILKNRRWDPQNASPEMVSATLAAGEAGGIAFAVRNQLSALSDRELLEYFRDLLTVILEDPRCQ